MEDGWELGHVYSHADQASGGKYVQGIFVDTSFLQTFPTIQCDFLQRELISGSGHDDFFSLPYWSLEEDLYSNSGRATVRLL